MTVTVRTQGHLKQFVAGQDRFTLELPAGATVRMLIEASGIPWDEIGLVAVGGQQAPDDAVLKDGDQVMLLAPMEGG